MPLVPIRAYWPVDPEIGRVPAIVFAHGGGWCLGSLNAYDTPCRSLAKATGCVVFSVDYRLAPEHPFPVPLDDVYAALDWVADHAAMLAVDEERLVIAGDSAGGNLAAAAALMARDRAGPKIAHQLLFYPALDIDLDTPSYRAFAEGYYLTREVMRFCWETYVGTLHDNVSVYAAPGRAAVAGLPSTTIFVCEFDPLRAEAEQYARRLAQAGIPVRLIRLEGLIHACLPAYDRADFRRPSRFHRRGRRVARRPDGLPRRLGACERRSCITVGLTRMPDVIAPTRRGLHGTPDLRVPPAVVRDRGGNPGRRVNRAGFPRGSHS
ncbi:alpha/beta hydrolase [Methylorubrum thiocyanatum]|uniref:alpha/beta hydrolase n=1 Tax=Methylorubrum thiocyanatum TaxID=47958 RepID=UPI0007C9014C|nr:hypothetical protein AX289_31785 [Methylorubrum populi]